MVEQKEDSYITNKKVEENKMNKIIHIKDEQINKKKNKKKKKKKKEGKSVTKEMNETSNLGLYSNICEEKKHNKKKKKKKEKDKDKDKDKLDGINKNSKKKNKKNDKSNKKEGKKLENNDERKDDDFISDHEDDIIYDHDDIIRDHDDDILDNNNNNNNNNNNKELKNNDNIIINNNNKVTSFDYERLIASEKNKSAIWISYIAFYLEQNNLEEARKVAERALKTIDIHEIDEKLNIYLCYINMECLYGDKLNDIFKRALLCNNEKSIYLHTIHILKKNKKLTELKDLCEEAIKKFKYSKKIWSCYLQILHNTFKDEEYAHNILLKSLHSLPKKKHLNMIINAARFEYKYSNKERGKTYFEKLIQEYPKRSDLWFTYLDIHINSLTKNENKEKIKLNLKELQFIRNIFERFLSYKFKPRVMKIIFTKWLLFEKSQGNMHSQKTVQEKAYNYVESLNALV
ncbi:rRNA biogenesis protein RRP5, putative [Plasmodium reichenowi]|uniref:rRNA biogenesis protein RRP5, putative n=1 Tax=Plasmodium reichenowi TaxID=5854 RepID=A0A151L418_PLARE|nr:rRNA biogenesis protein RRP5, putative [Plasmodium reichenowi]KYN93701.1 rRNA biogenesis protein RRP5, putative [Plasmodium reichenowi]